MWKFLLITLVLAMSANCQVDHTSWMSDLSRSVRARPITRIAIPGSHNSFTDQLDMNSEMADTSSFGWVDTLSRVISPFENLFGLNNNRNRNTSNNNGLGSSVRQVAEGWSKTQDIDVDQQLALGIRYFDARLGYQASTGRIRIVHGLYGRTLATVMNSIANYARTYRNEVFIVYFRNVINFDVDANRMLEDRCKQIFGDTLLAYQTANETRDLTGISLDYLASHRIGNVILVYAMAWNARGPGDRTVFWPPSSTVVTIWANSASTSVIRQQLNSAVVRYTTPDDRFSFFLELQGGVATGNTADIVGSVTSGRGNLRDDVAISTRNDFIQWLRSKKNDGTTPRGAINVCLSDFVNQAYVDAVLSLNDA